MPRHRSHSFPVLIAAALAVSRALAGPAAGGAPATSARRPNILFILTDDQRWDSMGAAGNKSIRTPALDRLAAGGARLDAFYVSSPLCSPSRASLLSGLYPHQTGVENNAGRRDLPDGTRTIAAALNQAGYLTGFIGKAHLGGEPAAWGFKESPIYYPYAQLRDPTDPEFVSGGATKKVKGTASQVFADAAIKFLETHRSDTFFLWLATTSPHEPHRLYPDHPYARGAITAPPGWPPGETFGGADWDAYYSTVTEMDAHLGRVLDALDRLGLAQNTFVLMTSDNGYMMRSHGQKAKIVWYEESSRVPALARWPGRIRAGSVVPFPASAVDLFPTFLDVAGVTAPPARGMEGKSLLPALTEGRQTRQRAYSEAKLPKDMEGTYWQMVRDDRWKYVRFDTGIEMLYDLVADPHEKKNLGKDTASAPRRAAMKTELDRWLAATPR